MLDRASIAKTFCGKFIHVGILCSCYMQCPSMSVLQLMLPNYICAISDICSALAIGFWNIIIALDLAWPVFTDGYRVC